MENFVKLREKMDTLEACMNDLRETFEVLSDCTESDDWKHFAYVIDEYGFNELDDIREQFTKLQVLAAELDTEEENSDDQTGEA